MTFSNLHGSIYADLKISYGASIFFIGYRYLAFWGGDFGSGDNEYGSTFHELELTLAKPLNGSSFIKHDVNKPDLFAHANNWTFSTTRNDISTVMNGVKKFTVGLLQYQDSYLQTNGGVLFYMDMGEGVYADVSAGDYWTFNNATFAIGTGRLYGTNIDPATFTEADRINPASYTLICDLVKNLEGES
jgi:hypothetical protein